MGSDGEYHGILYLFRNKLNLSLLSNLVPLDSAMLVSWLILCRVFLNFLMEGNVGNYGSTACIN